MVAMVPQAASSSTLAMDRTSNHAGRFARRACRTLERSGRGPGRGPAIGAVRSVSVIDERQPPPAPEPKAAAITARSRVPHRDAPALVFGPRPRLRDLHRRTADNGNLVAEP